ncbi:hypothetical protein G7Y89_g8139 [Cudoniella acicularis]|uniref:Uncharacterized protein n=1 Tax=Cudoniella acicularis TaxID=354080 RepID=A0A8H4RH67_9HELO|nr:hypothetical protein G7Y89_g8139 [Cudoniella acicularis]
MASSEGNRKGAKSRGKEKGKGKAAQKSSPTTLPVPLGIVKPGSVKQTVKVKGKLKVGESTTVPEGLNNSSNVSRSTSDPVPVKPSLHKRFYEAILMLHILGRNRGDRISEEDAHHSDPEPLELDARRLRRPFLRHLAYLCDFEKGGDSATAIAIQQTPQGVVYWVASNEVSGKSDRMKDFLGNKRIVVYSKKLESDIEFVLKRFEKGELGQDMSFMNWLRGIKGALRDPIDICRLCFNIRRSPSFETLQKRARSGAECASRFQSIRHQIGRLNHTMKAVKIVIAAGLYLPQLFDDFEIVREQSSRKSPPPLKVRNPSLMELAGRLAPGPAMIERVREGLQELDQRFQLSGELEKQCINPKWKPRVHAEILLIDRFWNDDMEFFDGDRYIGTSKAACYCCYHYMTSHPLGFKEVPCHNNIYLNWKAPDIYDESDSERIKARENILNEMAQKVKADVLVQINERRGPAKWHPDSWTEISSLKLQEVANSGDEASTNYELSDATRDELSDELPDELSAELSDAPSDALSDELSDIEECSDDEATDVANRSDGESEDEDVEGGVSLLMI